MLYEKKNVWEISVNQLFCGKNEIIQSTRLGVRCAQEGLKSELAL